MLYPPGRSGVGWLRVDWGSMGGVAWEPLKVKEKLPSQCFGQPRDSGSLKGADKSKLSRNKKAEGGRHVSLRVSRGGVRLGAMTLWGGAPLAFGRHFMWGGGGALGLRP